MMERDGHRYVEYNSNWIVRRALWFFDSAGSALFYI